MNELLQYIYKGNQKVRAIWI